MSFTARTKNNDATNWLSDYYSQISNKIQTPIKKRSQIPRLFSIFKITTTDTLFTRNTTLILHI